MDDRKEFDEQVKQQVETMRNDKVLHQASKDWILASSPHLYPYHFKWMGLPVIQMPQDLVAAQEIIWETKPDCIIETGVARGGSVVFYAGMQKMMGIEGTVIGIDIDVRPHNRESIENHPLAKNITLIEGSSIDLSVFDRVKNITKNAKSVLIILDSMHTHEHVLTELNLYGSLVKKNGYCVVFDTIVEDLPSNLSGDRPWGKGNNPKTAVWEFLKSNDRFEIDTFIETKLQITASPDGYLKCIKD